MNLWKTSLFLYRKKYWDSKGKISKNFISKCRIYFKEVNNSRLNSIFEICCIFGQIGHSFSSRNCGFVIVIQ
ncbi:hypothetical protein [Leptospira kirschneri]|uniref:Uncharacterized protein n=1 Tax=Leptospira kirschneri str. H1 TaxID=1049966 RepID=A0A0E2B6Z9_9LEPT|nr:hypothetical protein [Leptospira kirschneri]EKO17116.1 hypothetical protein LEP1GSC081_4374 [Leptospira kirschneri str. H1]EKO60044.1 hypothetical protein LEP1GSC082_3651 [Leptospira kirschneri str. H2]UML78628.1 hypothetical protein FH602_00165 [Leptospira kirschneri]